MRSDYFDLELTSEEFAEFDELERRFGREWSDLTFQFNREMQRLTFQQRLAFAKFRSKVEKRLESIER